VPKQTEHVCICITNRLLIQKCYKNKLFNHYFTDENMRADEDVFKLTPEEIANDPKAKKIHDALETVGKKNANDGKIGQSYSFFIILNFQEKCRLYNVRKGLAKQALYAILPKLFMK
jgi:hypothetical protein